MPANKHTVFVYGTLKQGYGNHRLLANSEYCGPAAFVTNEHTLRDLGAFPGVVALPPRPKDDQGVYIGRLFLYKIEGELYKVTDEELKALDRLEGHPSFYTRTRTNKVMQGDKTYSKCWIYTLPSEYFDNTSELPNHCPNNRYGTVHQCWGDGNGRAA